MRTDTWAASSAGFFDDGYESADFSVWTLEGTGKAPYANAPAVYQVLDKYSVVKNQRELPN